VSRAAGPRDLLNARDDEVVIGALGEVEDWRPEHVPRLIALLARESLLEAATWRLSRMGEAVVPDLAAVLNDDTAEFVVRRRIPAVLACIADPAADEALVAALQARRFEIRYRSALALVRRRRRGFPVTAEARPERIWRAIDAEVKRDRLVWELQKLLDDFEPDPDQLIVRRIGTRGELSLEHTFRMLSLVLDPWEVKAAFQGVQGRDERLTAFALEYLEHVLPAAIRDRLWLFIGDVSEHRRGKERRAFDEVVADLMTTSATLFAGDRTRADLDRYLRDRNEPRETDA
jgi:hypothetical protein